MTVGITMSEAITALVAEKRAVGYQYQAEQQVLARLEAFSRSEFPGLDTLSSRPAGCSPCPTGPPTAADATRPCWPPSTTPQPASKNSPT